MNVLVTGGAGFIGSHLCERLLAAGEVGSVTCVDDLSTGSLANVRHLLGDPRFRFVRESVREATTMATLVERCEMVFHLAAAVGVRLIVEQPVRTIETNIHGTEVVLGLAGKFGRKVLVASSSEVYGKSDRPAFGEDDDSVLGSTRFSRWCYACSKMVDEFLALAYHQEYGLPVVVVRLFNTVGPRETGSYGMVVPRFVHSAIRGEPLTVYGTGAQSRCFCNVSDVVGALVELAGCEAAVGEVVNVGTTESVTIDALADKVLELTASRSPKRYQSYEEAYGRPFDDMMRRMPDLQKIRRLIGYAPKVPLAETLRQVIDYERGRMGSAP